MTLPTVQIRLFSNPAPARTLLLAGASGDILQILDADGNASTFSKASYSNATLTLTVADSVGTIYLNYQSE